MLLVVLVSCFHRRACRLGSQTTNRFFNYSRDISWADSFQHSSSSNPVQRTGVSLLTTKALAHRGLTDGVRVNTINPGAITTGRLQHRIQAVGAEQGLDYEAQLKRW
jgi:hypothetical protein